MASVVIATEFASPAETVQLLGVSRANWEKLVRMAELAISRSDSRRRKARSNGAGSLLTGAGEIRETHSPLQVSADALLSKLSNPPYSRSVHHPAEGNESSKELKQKWGPYNDGDEWRVLRELERVGWVQGFLECYGKHTKAEHGSFSKPREVYVKKLSEWYGVNPDDPSEVDPKTMNDKIPEVLFGLHDQEKQ